MSYSLRPRTAPKGEPEQAKRKVEKPPKRKAPAKKKSKTTAAAEHEPEREHILEKGFVYFFYRPKVGHEEAHSAADVQRLYMLLCPHPTGISAGEKTLDKEHTKRLIILPRKKLPEAKKHARYWGFVKKVSKKIEEIDEQLSEEVYGTKTRGERHLEGARPAGEGVYALVKKGDHTHFAYVLEMPHDIGEVQQAFNIKHEGTFICTVKNPEQPSTYGAGLKGEQKAHFPKELEDRFKGITKELKFAPVDPPEFLDYEGAEIILIGVTEDIKAELHEAGKELEKTEEKDEKKVSENKLYEELHLSKKEHPPQPLMRGEWK